MLKSTEREAINSSCWPGFKIWQKLVIVQIMNIWIIIIVDVSYQISIISLDNKRIFFEFYISLFYHFKPNKKTNKKWATLYDMHLLFYSAAYSFSKSKQNRICLTIKMSTTCCCVSLNIVQYYITQTLWLYF